MEVSNYPLPQQRAEAMNKRRLGLGVTGLADALFMCGLRYGSPDAVAATGAWMQAIKDAALETSAALAEEKGAFPLLTRERLISPQLWPLAFAGAARLIARKGLRNGLLTSIAPTGTISLIAGNVSSGVEPIFLALI